MVSQFDSPNSTQLDEARVLEEGHLSRAQLVALALSSFVPAVGIASFPALLVGSAGYGSWVAALISVVAGFCIGWVVIKFAKRYVATGSLYSYVGEVFGPWARYIVGGSLFLGYLATTMITIVLFAMFAASFLTSVGVGGADSPWLLMVLFTIAAVIPAAVAFRGVDTSVRIAVTLAVLSVPLLLIITGATAMDTGLHLAEQLTLEGSSVTGIFTGLAAGAAWLVSFESAAAMAKETKNPKKNVPAAVMAWPLVLGTTYVVVTILQVPGLMNISDQLAAGASAPAALAINAGLGQSFAQITDLVLAIAVFAALIGFINYGSRFTKTLAEDGLLPSPFAKVHPRFHTPHLSIIINVGISYAALALMMLLNSEAIFTLYASVATLVVYFWILPYLLICAAAIVLLVREKKLTPLFVLACIIAAATMLWLYLNGIINPPPAPLDSMSYVALIAVFLVTIAFYAAGRSRRSSAVQRHPEKTPGEPEPNPLARAVSKKTETNDNGYEVGEEHQ